MAFSVLPVRSASDLNDARELFLEYAASLDVDLAFQGFEAELAQLPGKYAPPGGELLLARGEDGAPVGCVGLRPLDIPGACEVKRLYVRAAARGTGLGRLLAVSIVDLAASCGYREIMLDTLPSMSSAIALYKALGFRPIPAYWNNIVPGILYFGRGLDAA
jgi:GNAT superfamily N-acetyltransferase